MTDRTVALHGIERSAVISEDGRYRYRLDQRWGPGPGVTWVMLNPSTADADTDDPTIRRVRAFTSREGFAAFTVVNLFAYRATNPKVLSSLASALAVGPENDDHIIRAVCQADDVTVAAWGALPRWARYRDDEVLHLIHPLPLYRLGEPTAAGYPRHPLYLRRSASLTRWHYT